MKKCNFVHYQLIAIYTQLTYLFVELFSAYGTILFATVVKAKIALFSVNHTL